MYGFTIHFNKVPRTGFEPAHRLRLYHLKVACLPISPPGHFVNHSGLLPIPDLNIMTGYKTKNRPFYPNRATNVISFMGFNKVRSNHPDLFDAASVNLRGQDECA
jgi:hypothetical protein